MSKEEFREKLDSILKKFETVAVKGIEYATTVAKGLTMCYKDGVDKLLSEGLKVKEELGKSSLDDEKKNAFKDLLSSIAAFKKDIDFYGLSGSGFQSVENKLRLIPKMINVIRMYAEMDTNLAFKQTLDLYKHVSSVLHDYNALVHGYLLSVPYHIQYLHGRVDEAVNMGLDMDYLSTIKKVINPDLWEEYWRKTAVENPFEDLREIKKELKDLAEQLQLDFKDKMEPTI